MRIGGLIKFSLIDYPGKISAVIFTQGCNFRCPWCHNPELVYPDRFGDAIPQENILDFLEKRQGQLEGVVISGGEPTLQRDLAEFIQEIRDIGFAVKLDTNGSNPDVLLKLLEMNSLDYIAMDVKAPLRKYDLLTGVKTDLDKIQESIRLIIQSQVDHQFRTTFCQSYLDEKDLEEIRSLVKGTKCYKVQEFVPLSTGRIK